MSAKGHQTEKGPISKKELLSRIAAGEDGIVVPSLANQDWAAFQQDSLRDPTLINFLSCVLVPILTWLYPDITASELREAQLLGVGPENGYALWPLIAFRPSVWLIP